MALSWLRQLTDDPQMRSRTFLGQGVSFSRSMGCGLRGEDAEAGIPWAPEPQHRMQTEIFFWYPRNLGYQNSEFDQSYIGFNALLSTG